MVSTALTWLAGLVICLLVLPYLLGPVLIFLTLRFRMPPTVVAVDPRTQPLPDRARTYFAEAYQALTASDFELVGTMGLPDLTPNATSLFALYANRATGDLAMSAIVVAQSGLAPELRTSYVEFVRRYDDRVTIQTNNSAELSAFKQLPSEITTKFPQVTDIRRLYELHQRLVNRFHPQGRPVLRLDTEFRGNAVQYVSQAVLEETFRNQVATGYLTETSTGFRPTIIGSLIMTWQELWPTKAIRRARVRRRAEQMLAELEPQRALAG